MAISQNVGEVAHAVPFTVKPLTETIGAEVIGLDLSQQLDRATFLAVQDAWYAHNILLFRNQKLTQEAPIRFAENFGCLAMPIAKSRTGVETPIMLVSNIRENGKPIGDLPDGEMWFHSDQCYAENPCAGSMLYAIEIPSKGGNTLFANTYAAYDALPGTMQNRLGGLKAMNVYDYNLSPTKKSESPQAISPEVPHYAHPVVRTHPATGRKALYVNRLMTAYIDGMPPKDSQSLLSSLFDHQERREFVYEHVWRKDDLLMWDNRCTLHARTDFDPGERRLLRRVTVVGDKPF